MLTIIVFILALGLLIFVHELGHFMIARRNGIRAEEFGFGFPPRIIGIQFVSGKKLEKVSSQKEVKVELEDYKTSSKTELVKETIVEKVKEIEKEVPVGKWRIIWGKHEDDSPQEKKDLKEIEREKYQKGTIYSLNWIPLGGFVKIKGEDGTGKNESDSFASKSAWKRIKVLAAGVLMNFILAWFLITLTLMIGAPQSVNSGEKNLKNGKIQIAEVIPGTPAEKMGFKVGDQVIRCRVADSICNSNFIEVSQIQDLIDKNKGKDIILEIKRGDKTLELSGTPRSNYPSDQGPLGISLVKTAIVSQPWYQAIWNGLTTTIGLIATIFAALFNLVKHLVMGQKISMDVAGPVGIAVLTKQVTELGLVYILQFVAFLSINLGIINGFPIPALDGGRILFILIEKIKGSPVSQKVEQMSHSIGFALLIALMVLVTFRDIIKLDLLDKIKGLF